MYDVDKIIADSYLLFYSCITQRDHVVPIDIALELNQASSIDNVYRYVSDRCSDLWSSSNEKSPLRKRLNHHFAVVWTFCTAYILSFFRSIIA